jgi:hypothetical protein
MIAIVDDLMNEGGEPIAFDHVQEGLANIQVGRSRIEKAQRVLKGAQSFRTTKVQPTNPGFQKGDRVQVVKEGTMKGETAAVVDADWSGRVKVEMEGADDGQVKSYLRSEIVVISRKVQPLHGMRHDGCWFHKIPLFHPDDKLIQHWDLVMVILLIYTAFYTTWECSFPDAAELAGKAGFIADFLVMICFFLDIMKSFNLAYEAPFTRLKVTSRWSIAKKYARGWFLLDFGSTMPWDLLGVINGSQPRLIRLLRLAKLARLLRLNSTLTKVMKETAIKMSNFAFLKTLALVCVVVHWSSCLWILIGQIDETKGWMGVYIYQNETEPAVFDAPPFNITNTSFSERLFRRLKVKDGVDVVGDDEPTALNERGWYFLCVEFTLAALGIWPYPSPEPVTAIESWFSIFLVFIAASIYVRGASSDFQHSQPLAHTTPPPPPNFIPGLSRRDHRRAGRSPSRKHARGGFNLRLTN